MTFAWRGLMTSTAYIESENEIESSPSMNTSHFARQDSLDFSACSKSSRLSPAPFKSSWLSGPCYLHGPRPSAVRAERSVPSLTLTRRDQSPVPQSCHGILTSSCHEVGPS